MNKMITAIIQARMNSNRLPGKVLMPLVGKPVLAHIIERLSRSRMLNNIVVATSTQASDDKIIKFCESQGVLYYRGSLDDVLDRYYKTAQTFASDIIVRITGDCPVIDPVVLDAVISGFLAGNYDCYGLGGEFPDGLDCTVIRFHALEKAWQEAILKSEREHVVPYISKNPNIFNNGNLQLFNNLSHERWTLDEKRDYDFLNVVFDSLYKENEPFLTHEILEFLDQNPELRRVNQGIIRNEGYIKSIQAEKEISK